MKRPPFDFASTPASPGRPQCAYRPAQPEAAPAVSIITPYYDTGEVFLETARCVERQSLQQWEWLIVNDGSSRPDALRLLDGFRDRDPRIRVVDMPRNRGLPAARNVGLGEARAELVFFLDSDDLLEPTTLEKTAWSLLSYPEFSFCKGLTVHFGAEEGLAYAGFETGKLFLSRNVVTIRCMVRREVALAAGGFDESLVHGLEDWDFWLKCAARGHWGHTIPEFLDWYRRRETHSDRWSAWTPQGVREMRRELRRRYPALFAGQFPATTPKPLGPYAGVPDDWPFDNLLARGDGPGAEKRVLLIAPWMALGGSDKFNLDLLEQLRKRGAGVSMATTLPGNYPWQDEFARLTPDLFVLPNFLRPRDYPRFLAYLVRSRQIDAVVVSNSEHAYRFLPLLRDRCPDTAFLDFCHMEEAYWNNGGHPRQAVAYQEALDLNVVSSRHLKGWMVERGADPSQIEVCYTNVDGDRLAPIPGEKERLRREMGLVPDVPVILYAGRVCQQKQPQVFARAVQLLHERKLRFVCLVAGDGEEKGRLIRTLRRHRLTSHVRMLGAVRIEGMRDLYAASDLLLLPSLQEGIALTLYEAMAMGVVPVSADVGGQSELVTPECGVLVKRGSEEVEARAYADALERLILSPEIHEAMGRAARQRVCEDFHIEQMGDRMEELLALAARYHRERAKPAPGPRLAREHAVQAVEHARVLEAAGPLWKYQRVEAVRRRAAAAAKPLRAVAWRLLGWAAPVVRLARGAKDWAWVRAHQIKMRIVQR